MTRTLNRDATMGSLKYLESLQWRCLKAKTNTECSPSFQLPRKIATDVVKKVYENIKLWLSACLLFEKEFRSRHSAMNIVVLV